MIINGLATAASDRLCASETFEYGANRQSTENTIRVRIIINRSSAFRIRKKKVVKKRVEI